MTRSTQAQRAACAGTAGTAQLSRRKLETLCLLLEGLSEKQIAAELGLSQHTVHDYVKALYRTFNVRSRPELHAHVAIHGAPSPRADCIAQRPRCAGGCARVVRE